MILRPFAMKLEWDGYSRFSASFWSFRTHMPHCRSYHGWVSAGPLTDGSTASDLRAIHQFRTWCRRSWVLRSIRSCLSARRNFNKEKQQAHPGTRFGKHEHIFILTCCVVIILKCVLGLQDVQNAVAADWFEDILVQIGTYRAPSNQSPPNTLSIT